MTLTGIVLDRSMYMVINLDHLQVLALCGIHVSTFSNHVLVPVIADAALELKFVHLQVP
jgi:hypothetical protein